MNHIFQTSVLFIRVKRGANDATKSDATKSDSFSHCFLCYMLHATSSNMFVINWCSMLQTTFDLCLNSVRMCMDVRNTLEILCVQLNMTDTNMSAGESSCDEKHEKRKTKRKMEWREGCSSYRFTRRTTMYVEHISSVK